MSNSKKIKQVDGYCENCGKNILTLRKVTGLSKLSEYENSLEMPIYERYFLECTSCYEFLDLEYIDGEWREKLFSHVDAVIGHCESCGARHEVEYYDTGCMCGGNII